MHDDMTCYTRVDRACACCSLSDKDIEDIDNPLLLHIHTRHPVLLPGHTQGCCCSALGAPSCARHLCCNLYLSALACGEYVQVYVSFFFYTAHRPVGPIRVWLACMAAASAPAEAAPSSKATSSGWALEQQYELLGKIGEGTYGVVYLAADRADRSRLLAIKKFKTGRVWQHSQRAV